MLESIPASLFQEWKAFYMVEPFGEWRNDVRFASLTSLIANINRDTKKRNEPFTIDDFMPNFTSQIQPPDKTEMLKQKMLAIAAAFGVGKNRKKKGKPS